MTHEIPVSPMRVSDLSGHTPSPYPNASEGGTLFASVTFELLYHLGK